MSGLKLRDAELTLLGRALDVLASPLESEDVDDWRRDATRLVKKLVGGDRAIFSLPGAATTPLFSEEYGRDVFDSYLGHYRHLDVGRRRLMEAQHEVFCKRLVYAEGLSPPDAATYREYSADFLEPLRIHDSIGMVADMDAERQVALWVHHERFGTEHAGERGMRLFRLLLPAFRAGVTMWQRLHDVRGRLGALLDEIGEAVLLLERDGSELHRSRALRSLLRGNPEAEAVEARLRAAGRSVARDGRGEPVAARRGLEERFTAGGSTFDLNSVVLNRPLGLDREVVLVSLRPAGRPPPLRKVRRAFGLTPREAEVAQLLWRRKTNREIASELTISPHTARRHTERVREKLGVSTRLDVRRVLELGVTPD